MPQTGRPRKGHLGRWTQGYDMDRTASAPLGALLGEQTRRLGHAPLLTYYDDAGGERTELSYATFDNWVSKTANLLAEELAVQPGGSVALRVDDHWTGAVIALAALRTGARLLLGSATSPHVDVAVVREGTPLDRAANRRLVVGDGMGGRVVGDPDGLPYGDEVLAFGDHFEDAPCARADVAVVDQDGTHTHGELLALAPDAVPARILSTDALSSVAAMTGLVTAIAGGGSLVWCPRSAGANLVRRRADEQVTAIVVQGRIEPA